MGASRVSSSGTRSAYAGGFSESTKRQLEGANLPDKIKCKTCGKLRLQLSYSNRQLDLVRHALVVKGPKALNAGHAICRMCTGGQLTELKCCICEQVKGLSEFAINQRKEHEHARCLNCVQGHKDSEPILDENKLLTGSETSTTKGSITSSHVGSSLAESTRRLTLSETPGNGSSSVNNASENVPHGGGIWVEPARHEAPSSKGGLGVSSYNPYSDATVAAGGAKSINSGWQTYGITSSRKTASVCSDAERKFARVKAYRAEVQVTLPPRAPEAAPESVVQADDDDEDEDSDSDFTEFV